MDRAAIEPCFSTLPEDQQAIRGCTICGAPYTRFTMLHLLADACTGCMLRTLRPYDYVVQDDA